MWEIALEYLDLAEAHPCPISYVRGHIFKMLHHCLQLEKNFDLREIIAKTSQMEGFREAVVKLRERYIDFHTGSFFMYIKTKKKIHFVIIYIK